MRDLATGRLRRVPGGTQMSTYCGSAATPSTGPRLPQKLPQITRAFVPSSSVTSGMSFDETSWYLGCVILSDAGRFAHNWKPCIWPRSLPCGISWWTMPLPAVIHCTSPALMLPLLPRLSPWSTLPAST